MTPSQKHQNLIILKKSIFDFVEVVYIKMEEMILEKRRIKLKLNNKSCREFFKE